MKTGMLILLFALILICGCNNSNNTRGWTPLHSAAFDNDLTETIRLINEGADINAQVDRKGWTALHVAAMMKNEEVYDLLVSKSANTEIKDFYGDTASYLAELSKN